LKNVILFYDIALTTFNVAVQSLQGRVHIIRDNSFPHKQQWKVGLLITHECLLYARIHGNIHTALKFFCALSNIQVQNISTDTQVRRAALH